jgi:hypothetical protein
MLAENLVDVPHLQRLENGGSNRDISNISKQMQACGYPRKRQIRLLAPNSDLV